MNQKIMSVSFHKVLSRKSCRNTIIFLQIFVNRGNTVELRRGRFFKQKVQKFDSTRISAFSYFQVGFQY